MLDEGFLTDSQGHKVDFRNVLIVFTSNLGADILCGNDPLHPYHEEPNGDVSPKVRDAVMDIVSHNYAPEYVTFPCPLSRASFVGSWASASSLFPILDRPPKHDANSLQIHE